jgi:hypothetical protein
MRWLLLLAMTSTIANADPRTEFAAKLALVKPGMTADEVTKILGAPDDVKTEKDSGGIAAARTAEIWRYGAVGHLKVATLGSVHIQADNKVQYVFGAKGKVLTGMPEQQLRNLMQLLDNVPSYNEQLDPLRLVRAVNALHALGKDKALDVVEEYLRVSSSLDDPGREGVFLVMRVLFDVKGDMPPMMVGAASPAPDKKLFPRHPIVMIGDLPIKIVRGYALGGKAQDPESDVAAFRKVGVLRAKPLAPSGKALHDLDTYLATPAGKLVDRNDVIDQVLHFFGTVYIPANHTIDTWFPDPKWLPSHLAALAMIKPTWNAKTQQMEDKGKAMPPPTRVRHQRVWWDLGLAGATKARLTFERLDDELVAVELRLEGNSVTAQTLKIVDQKSGVLAKLDIRGGNSVMTQRVKLPKGQTVRAELASGPRSPDLTP